MQFVRQIHVLKSLVSMTTRSCDLRAGMPLSVQKTLSLIFSQKCISVFAICINVMSISSNSHQNHDSKLEFTQKKISKIIFFHAFQLFSYMCKRYYSKKSKYMKKMLFDKCILTKTHLRVKIWKNIQHQVKSPIMWTFLV